MDLQVREEEQKQKELRDLRRKRREQKQLQAKFNDQKMLEEEKLRQWEENYDKQQKIQELANN